MRKKILYAILFVLLAGANVTSAASNFSLMAGAATPLTAPQTDIFKTGGSFALKMFVPMGEGLDFGFGTAYLNCPVLEKPIVSLGKNYGYASAFGFGPKFNGRYGSWIDANALYVRTGELNRFGFSGTLGFAFPVNESRSVKVGPFASYFQIVQSESKEGYDNRDAKFLTFGLNVELGSAVETEEAENESWEDLSEEVPIPFFPDRDNDGVRDDIDVCPDEPGTPENKGCPPGKYQGLVITKEKIVLEDEIIHFYYDSAQIKPESLPILCEIAEFLRENPSIHIRIEGHASSEGGDEYNLHLSDRRSLAIRDQLIACGIDASRLTTQPHGESELLMPDDNTEAERELNRRVEFVITKGGK